MKLVRGEDVNIINCQKCTLKKVLGRENNHTCEADLREFSAPITLNDQHIATIFVGRIFLEKPDEQKITKISQETGMDREKVRQYINEIPIVSEKEAKVIADTMGIVVTSISQLAYREMKFQSEIKMLTLLKEIGEAINSPSKLDELLKLLYEKAKKIIDYDCLSIQLLDESTQIPTLRSYGSYGAGKEILKISEFKEDEGYAGWVLKNKEPLIIFDSTKPQGITFDKEGNLTRKVNVNIKYPELVSCLKSFILVPLKLEDKIVGAFIFGNTKKNAFEMENIAPVITIANQASIAIDKAKRLEKLESTNIERDKFLSELHHELLSPLATLAMFTDHLITVAEQRHIPSKGLYQSIKAHSERFNEMIRNIFPPVQLAV